MGACNPVAMIRLNNWNCAVILEYFVCVNKMPFNAMHKIAHVKIGKFSCKNIGKNSDREVPAPDGRLEVHPYPPAHFHIGEI